MSKATRGANAKKPVLPNLAAAGRKKPEKTEETVNAETKAPIRGPSTKARGRGRNIAPKTSNIVQTEGTFTQGLRENTSKPTRLNALGNEEVVGKLERSVGANGVPKVPKKEKDVEEDVSDKSEEEWQSDDEQDKILLYELIKPSIIADLKKGQEMPLVLPQKDTSQFVKLVKDQNDQLKQESSQNLDRKEESRTSAEIFEKYMNEETNDLILMQLPASLNLAHQNFETPSTAIKMEIDTASSSAPNPVEESQKHCTDGLPADREIGKIQVMKSGKMRLVIGDRVMEMHEAIPSQMFETIVQTQTNTENGTNTGSMTVLGNVGDSFLCTYSVP